MLTCRASEGAARHHRRRELKTRRWCLATLQRQLPVSALPLPVCLLACRFLAALAHARALFRNGRAQSCSSSEQMSLTWRPGASEHAEHELKRERADEYGGRERVTKERKNRKDEESRGRGGITNLCLIYHVKLSIVSARGRGVG